MLDTPEWWTVEKIFLAMEDPKFMAVFHLRKDWIN